MGDENLVREGIDGSNGSGNPDSPHVPNEHITEHREHSHHHSHHGEHSHGGSHSHHRSGSHGGGSSSHGSSHRRYHNSKKRRSSSDKQGLVSKIKKLYDTATKKNKISIICSLALIVVMLFSITLDLVGIVRTRHNKNQDDIGATESNMALNVELINSDGVLVHTPVLNYMQVSLINNPDVLIRNFAVSNVRLDAQKPVSLKLSTKDTFAYAYKIEFADNSEFKNACVDYLNASNGIYTFHHLYTNTEYYYRVIAYTANGKIVKTGQFCTADTPRILTIDGISNVRDIGNWKTDSGKRIKQGLLIRGTELDGAVESVYCLSNEGLSDMLTIYGIKFDMDLRSKAETIFGKDALGANVEHKYYASPMYRGIFTIEGKATIRDIFKDLSNPNNYPMYMHCTYGADRTGTVCYLLEAVLGVSRGDCLKEYGLTQGLMTMDNILSVEEGLKLYDESGTMTLKEQAEAYLISCGITMTEINAIRDIFLGE